MSPYVDEIERAFQLARSGAYETIPEIRKRLAAEGYWGERITGRLLLRQLREQLQARRTDAPSQKNGIPPAP